MIRRHLRENIPTSIILFALILAAAFFAICAFSLRAQEARISGEKKNLYLGGDFDEWDWVPIPYNAIKGLKKKLKAGIDINCEVRGPLFRVPAGLAAAGPCGYMVEGPEAYKGRSLRVVADDPKNPFIVGQYLSNLRTDRRLGWEIFVKGKGEISLMVWLGGIKKTTGEFTWVGFPNIFSVKATDKWVRHAGSFTFPEPEDPDVIMDQKATARLLVQPGSDLMIDELKVWEEQP